MFNLFGTSEKLKNLENHVAALEGVITAQREQIDALKYHNQVLRSQLAVEQNANKPKLRETKREGGPKPASAVHSAPSNSSSRDSGNDAVAQAVILSSVHNDPAPSRSSCSGSSFSSSSYDSGSSSSYDSSSSSCDSGGSW